MGRWPSMRPRFSDIDKIKALAKKEVETGLGKIKDWWTRKYNLPTNHTLFMNRNVPSLHQEMYEDLFTKKEDLEEALLENDDGKMTDSLLKQINSINSILGEEEAVADSLVDKWEKELAEGKTPNLEEY